MTVRTKAQQNEAKKKLGEPRLSLGSCTNFGEALLEKQDGPFKDTKFGLALAAAPLSYQQPIFPHGLSVVTNILRHGSHPYVPPEDCWFFETRELWDIPAPFLSSDILEIAAEFEERWKLPNCVGALDGKHITIECPSLSGSLHQNYKGSFSKSLLAISNAKYRFLYVEVGHHGSESDGGIFARSKIQQLIVSGEQGLASPTAVGEVGELPYYLVGDEAFPLKPYLMRPYPRRSFTGRSEDTQPSASEPSNEEPQDDGVDNQLPDDEGGASDQGKKRELRRRRKIFNYRLSRGRRVVENTFGILAQRWRILRRPFRASEVNTDKIVAACVVLHNFLLKESEASAAAYCPPGTADQEDWEGRTTEGTWRRDADSNKAGLRGIPRRGYNSAKEAYQMRDKLAHHFLTGGAVRWQDKVVMGPCDH